MKFSKIVISSCFVLGFSLSSFAGELNYNCIGLARGGGEIQGEISIKANSSHKIMGAKVVLSVWDRVVTKEFRGPLKTPKANSDIQSAFLDGAKNSRINPFADFDYLHFDGQLDVFKLSDLSDKISLTIDSTFGPVGNRGGDRFSLICGLRN